MKLALFFTRGISLKIWLETGLFDREKLVYEEHLRQGNLKKVYWITYGSGDKKIAEKLKIEGRLHKDIEILQMPKAFNSKLGKLLYSFYIPFIYGEVIKKVDILKTNQMDGSWSAVISKWLYKKPLIIRTGYTASLFARRLSKFRYKYKIYEFMEKFAYNHCNLAVVASKRDRNYICSKYNIPQDKVFVIYNYIDTKKFRPIPDIKKYGNRLIYVGRLTKQKNLFNLVKAISRLNLTLDIYGSGELEEDLKKEVKRLRANVNFQGTVSNDKLPIILNRYRYFILPSYFEGMPKSLLEAMACGILCIGTNVEGINEVIEDGKTGILACNTDVNSLVKAIKRAFNLERNNYQRIVHTARSFIENNFSLQACIEKEKKLFNCFKEKDEHV